MSFQGKVVIVTGATGNLGRAVVQRFASEGARLVLVDRNAEAIEKYVTEAGIRDYLPSITDAGNPESVEAMIAAVEQKYGQIDVLAHTVGGYDAGKAVHEAGSLEVYEKMMNLNVRPIYVLAGRVARYMVEKGAPGKIVVVLARAALKGGKGSGAYTASKAAALRVVESMAAELRDMGINVNGVAPSIIDTPLNRKDMPNADFEKWVKPAQLADAIAFLASDAAHAVHGTMLEVYGRA
ncbi:MAG: SDR family NAD(P)-dependent oxidoreductase [Chloroflexi bacterium]|nr:SDR family NAD(P)-dependent oxidoreductase [Chloroflexota bacterium]